MKETDSTDPQLDPKQKVSPIRPDRVNAPVPEAEKKVLSPRISEAVEVKGPRERDPKDQLAPSSKERSSKSSEQEEKKSFTASPEASPKPNLKVQGEAESDSDQDEDSKNPLKEKERRFGGTRGNEVIASKTLSFNGEKKEDSSLSVLFDDDEYRLIHARDQLKNQAKIKKHESSPDEKKDDETEKTDLWEFKFIRTVQADPNKPGAKMIAPLKLNPLAAPEKMTPEQKQSLIEKIIQFFIKLFQKKA